MTHHDTCEDKVAIDDSWDISPPSDDEAAATPAAQLQAESSSDEDLESKEFWANLDPDKVGDDDPAQHQQQAEREQLPNELMHQQAHDKGAGVAILDGGPAGGNKQLPLAGPSSSATTNGDGSPT